MRMISELVVRNDQPMAESSAVGPEPRTAWPKHEHGREADLSSKGCRKEIRFLSI